MQSLAVLLATDNYLFPILQEEEPALTSRDYHWEKMIDGLFFGDMVQVAGELMGKRCAESKKGNQVLGCGCFNGTKKPTKERARTV